MPRPEVAARSAIAEAVHNYAFLLDTGKFADLALLFTSTARLHDPHGSSLAGPDAVIDYLKSAITAELPPSARPPLFMRHNITSHRATFVGASSAKSDSYFLAVTDAGLDHWGRYRDRMVCDTDGAWRFDDRQVIVEGYAADSWYGSRAAATRS